MGEQVKTIENHRAPVELATFAPTSAGGLPAMAQGNVCIKPSSATSADRVVRPTRRQDDGAVDSYDPQILPHHVAD